MSAQPVKAAEPAVEALAPRTGPVGRAARLLLAALLIVLGYDLWVDRRFIFAEADPGLLLLTCLALYGAYQTGALVGRGRETVVGIGALGAAAAAVAAATAGALWAPPLSWLVWGLDIGIVALVAAALLAAVVIGTPGCEIGVFAELNRRLRRGEAMFCLVGLHKLDEWEDAQPWRRRVGRRRR